MKKRILSIIIALLFLSTPAWANSIMFHKNRLLKVAGGTFTAANARSSYANTVAFACANGVDLSAYAGTDAGYTPYVIVFQDATGGDTAIGYLGANGTAETLSGSELLTNPSFDTNTTGWSTYQGAIASVTGGQSNNCCELTRVSGTLQTTSQTFTTVVKALYKISTYIKSGSSGNEQYWLLLEDASTGLDWCLGIGTSSASWVQNVGYVVALDTDGRFILVKNSATAGTMLFDETSVKQVTDCAATGLHVMSAKNGTTQSWYYISPTFGFNDATIIYRIYRVY